MLDRSLQLTASEADSIKKLYDHSGGLTGFVRIRQLLSECGQNLSDSEVTQLLSAVNYQEGHILPLSNFLQLMQMLKQQHGASEDTDTGDAFVALGGNRDKSGQIDAKQLREAVKLFELTIDIEKLLLEVDSDGSGLIEFPEFETMLEHGTALERNDTDTKPVRKGVGAADGAAVAGGWWRIGYNVSVAQPQDVEKGNGNAPEEEDEEEAGVEEEPEEEPATLPAIVPVFKRKATMVKKPVQKHNFLTSGANRQQTDVVEEDDTTFVDAVHQLGYLPAFLRSHAAVNPVQSAESSQRKSSPNAKVNAVSGKQTSFAGPLQQPHGIAEQFASHHHEELCHLLPQLGPAVLKAITADHFTASLPVRLTSPVPGPSADTLSTMEFLPPCPGKCNLYTTEQKLARWTA